MTQRTPITLALTPLEAKALQMAIDTQWEEDADTNRDDEYSKALEDVERKLTAARDRRGQI